MTKLFIDCSCGFAGECDSDIEYYKHENTITCVHNLYKNSPNWFQTLFDNHCITFKSKEQLILELRNEGMIK